jgi:aryl-alcohol dehydrogenase-like predicted oxidoreductase
LASGAIGVTFSSMARSTSPWSLTRRHAVKQTLGVAGALWGTLRGRRLLAAAGPAVKKSTSDVVTLGQTGIKLSRMALGTGTHGVNKTSVQGRLGINGFAELLCHAYDEGLHFWEGADQYGTHPHLREGMRRVGKNNVVVMTKTRALTAADVQADLDRFRRELGRDYIDIVLLHCMTSDNWPKEMEGPMEVLERARQKGIIRAHGVSCHTLGALKAAARTPWVQVDLARINPRQAAMDADPETVLGVLREMKRAGKGILGMKIFGAGRLTDDIEGSLRYCARLDVLDAFTIGFSSAGQLDEVVTKFPTLAA